MKSEHSAHLALVNTANSQKSPLAFVATIAGKGKPNFTMKIHGLSIQHVVKECEMMLLPGDSLTVEALT